jgi:D-alanyl-lipoteichoic acid acyltransferase DltB (MBOAT superfamily)
MNFASFNFWMYLILGASFIRLLRIFVGRINQEWIQRYDKISLLLLSLSLLYRESPVTLGAFLYVSSVIWFGTIFALNQASGHRGKVIVGVVVGLSLAPLIYFKYANFLCSEVFNLTFVAWSKAMIPAGLSFYTFQLVGFMVDRIVRDEHEKLKLADYINFASFFPQIVAGPIERAGHLLPQVHRFSWKISPRHLNEAVGWVVYGLFLKLAIANNIAGQTGWITYSLENPFQIWLGNFVFAYRIYFDFAGYSFIAIGLGKLLGIDLTVNFRSPYTAINIQEFWRRWHITLSGWFRDYVYLPLGGNRTGKNVMRNIIIVFVVSGIWHGAGWNFVIWGAYHGLLLCLFRMIKPRIRLHPLLSWSVCFIAVLASWLLFYETNTLELISKLSVMLNPLNYTVEALQNAVTVCPGLGNQVTLALVLGMSVAVHILEYISFRTKGSHASFFLHPISTICMAMMTVVLAPTTDNGFIYFNF